MINWVLAILVHLVNFGSFWLTGFILVHFGLLGSRYIGSFGSLWFILVNWVPLQNKHGKSADFHGNFAENTPRFSWFSADLKSVENDQSSAESMEIMIRLNVGYKSVENAERMEHNYCSFYGVMESVERVENVEYNPWKFHEFHVKRGNFANSTENVENNSKRLS